MCFTSSSYTTLSSVTQAGLTIPAGLDTKINKHIGFWGQISRLILEIWYERLTEKHTVESQSTGCHHFRWSGVKKAAHSPFTAWKQCFIHSPLAARLEPQQSSYRSCVPAPGFGALLVGNMVQEVLFSKVKSVCDRMLTIFFLVVLDSGPSIWDKCTSSLFFKLNVLNK